MSNKRRNRITGKSARQGIMGKARTQMKLAANLTEEQDWYLDTPDVRLTRIFTVVILLHLIAGGGLLAFKMVDKASDTSGIKISSARQTFESAVQESKELASAVPAPAGPGATSVKDAPARHAPAAPLRPDPSKGDQYKVQAGDTLPEIATQLGVSADALRSANAIKSDNELYPGRWITVPVAKAVGAAPSASNSVSNTANNKAEVAKRAENQPVFYEVKAGDTAWAISRKFNVSYNQLMSENGIANAETLQIGQKLSIPKVNQ